VKEMSGGMKAWQALGFPTEYVDEVALASQHEPLAV
jgi:hypothetical protein